MKEKGQRGQRGGARKALAFLLTLVMVCTYSGPIAAFGGETGETGEAGNAWQIVSGGEGGIRPAQPVTSNGAVKDHPWDVSTTKTVYETDMENEFEIELKVKTSVDVSRVTSKNVEIVLVLDTSGSMETKLVAGGTDRMGAAREAATGFVRNLLTTTSQGIKIGLVTFSGSSTAVEPMTTDPKALIDKIGKLTAEGGTFMQAGLRAAQTMLDKGDQDAQKFIVILGDGAPTYRYSFSEDVDNKIKGRALAAKNLYEYSTFFRGSYHEPYLVREFTDDTDGSGADVGTRNIAATVSEAVQIKDKGSIVYAIGCGKLNKEEQRILRNVSTDPMSGTYFTNVADRDIAATLANTFQIISQNIVTAAQAWRVTDEMGELIRLAGPASKEWSDYGVTVTADQNGSEILDWNLRDLTGQGNCRKKVSGGYEYTLRYKIKLDTEAENFVSGQEYDTNGVTELDFVIDSDVDASQRLVKRTLHFVSPMVKGKLPVYEDALIKYYKIGIGEAIEQAVSCGTDYNLNAVTKGAVFEEVAVGQIDRCYDDLTKDGKAYVHGEIRPDANATFSRDNKIVKVYYQEVKPEQVGYVVEHYKQAKDGTYEWKPFRVDSGVNGIRGEKLAGSKFKLSEDALVSEAGIGFEFRSYDPETGEIILNGDSQEKNVIKLYYGMIMAQTDYELTVTHHYEGIITPQAITMPYTPDVAVNLKDFIKEVYNTVQYHVTKLFVTAKVNKEVQEDLERKLADAVIDYSVALENLRADERFKTSMAAIESGYAQATATTAELYRNALAAYDEADTKLKSERDGKQAVLDAKTTAQALGVLYQTALDGVTKAGITAAAGLSYEDILALYDKAIADAQAEAAAAAAVAASPAGITVPELPGEPKQEDSTKSEPTTDGAVTLPDAQASVEPEQDLDELKAKMEAKQADKKKLEELKEAFIEDAQTATNAERQAQLMAEAAYDAEVAKAEKEYEDALAASLEKAAMEKARQDAEDAAKKAFDAKAEAYRAFVKEIGASEAYKEDPMVIKALAVLKIMENAELELKELWISAGAAKTEIDEFKAEELLFTFTAGWDYEIDIYYELPVIPDQPNPPDRPERPYRPYRPRTPDITEITSSPAIIKDEEIPMEEAPEELQIVMIEEPQVPVASLPKTGGVGSLCFLGMGAAIAALGAALKRKEDREK